jgi:hypothetical protein
MGIHKTGIALALVTGVSIVTYAQTTQPVVKLPNEIEFKAPASPGPQNALLTVIRLNRVCTFSELSFHRGPKSCRTGIPTNGAPPWSYPGRFISASAKSGMKAR